MQFRFVTFFLIVLTCLAADDPIPARLAREARKAADSGQVVRAYLLYSEAAVRDPANPSYRANRDALAPAARLLTKAEIQTADIAEDVMRADGEAMRGPAPIERASLADWQSDETLKPLPQVASDSSRHNFNIRANGKSLCEQVAAAWGIKAELDRELGDDKVIHFELSDVDFRTALEAVTAATHSFVFPVSEKTIYFAPDTEPKRLELEPMVVLTFPIPDASNEKELIEAANAVRGLLSMRAIGWDSATRTVMIRDRVTRARIGRSVIEALLLPRAQVSFEVEFLNVDTDNKLHYGATLQTAFQIIDFGHYGFQSILPAFFNTAKFGTFGAGMTLFGLGLADASAFASYSNSISRSVFVATVVVADQQTANLHIGDKYPIPTSLYTGFSQGAGSIYNPAPQISLEDLGLILKLTPHVNGEGDIDLAVEAEYKALGTLTLNTVPSVLDRSFKGSVSLREGQWAILAGIDSKSTSVSRSGLAGLASVPGLSQLLTDNNRETQTSNTLLVIKPTITRLPMDATVSPQYLLGPQKGARVVI